MCNSPCRMTEASLDNQEHFLSVFTVGITIHFWQRLCSICDNYDSIGPSLQSLKLGWHHTFDPNIPRDSLDSQYLNELTWFFRLKGCSYFLHFRGKSIILIRSQLTLSISRVSAFPWDLISCPRLVLSYFSHIHSTSLVSLGAEKTFYTVCTCFWKYLINNSPITF